jgi:hypothetical protein
MAQDDTIQDIIERIQQARDRCQNAADQQGVHDADQAIGDLRDLGPAALPTAHDIEDYFNERLSTRETGTKAPQDPVQAEDEPVPIRRPGVDRTGVDRTMFNRTQDVGSASIDNYSDDS